jgi:hypothetical protein
MHGPYFLSLCTRPYFLSLCAQTALALLALGLAGGGLINWLHRPHRRWLWLASPLAGLMAMAAFLPLVHHGFGLPIPWATLAVWVPLCLLTVWSLRESPPRFRVRLQWLAAPVILGVVAWAVYACNKPAVRSDEPAMVPMDGSDMFGYAAYADWLLGHPGVKPPWDPERPHLAYPNFLWEYETRHSAFLLLGASAWLRGTSSIFSYDWLHGVALAAGVLGLGGLFATRRLGLLLLLAAGALSAWFAISRSGYLGRGLAYPGAILLAHALWACWERPSWKGLTALGIVGAGISLSLHPGVTQVVAGLLVVGALPAALLCRRPLVALGDAEPARVPTRSGVVTFLVALTLTIASVGLTFVPSGWVNLAGLALGAALVGLRYSQPRRAREAALFGLSGRCLAAGLLAYLVACGPVVVFTRFTVPEANGYACTIVPWDWALPLCLDLESANLRLLAPDLVMRLVIGCAVLSSLLLLVAWRARSAEALALSALGWVVIGGCYFGQNRIYVFAGLLFPLTACGAVLSWQRLGRSLPVVFRLVPLLLVIAFVGLRTPQHLAHWDRYARYEKRQLVPYTRSEMEALARHVGTRRLDVVTTQPNDDFMMLVELGREGCQLQMRRPTWQQMLSWCQRWGWTAPPDCPVRGDFTLSDSPALVAGQPLLLQTAHYALAADRDAVSVLGYDVPHGLGRDDQGLVVWLGRRAARIEVCNGSGEGREVILSATCSPGPMVADQTRRSVLVRMAGESRRVELTGRESPWVLRVPLRVPPGKHVLELVCDDVPDVKPGTDPRDLILLLRKVRLAVPSRYKPDTDGRRIDTEVTE